VDLDFAVHVPLDELRNVGPGPGPAEGRPLPDTARHELEGTRADLLARAGHAEDGRLAPAAMARFERRSHGGDVARAVERVVGAADLVRTALRHVHEMGDEITANL